MGFHHQANRLALVNVQGTMFNQVGVHGGIKPLVIDDVVHMAVHIVVTPACGDAFEGVECGTGQRLGARGGGAHGGSFCQSCQTCKAWVNVLICTCTVVVISWPYPPAIAMASGMRLSCAQRSTI